MHSPPTAIATTSHLQVSFAEQMCCRRVRCLPVRQHVPDQQGAALGEPSQGQTCLHRAVAKALAVAAAAAEAVVGVDVQLEDLVGWTPAPDL
jgi:hypothetical protein